MSAVERPPLCFIGAGRLARTFLPILADAGWPIRAVVARRLTQARSLCRGRDILATTDLAEGTADARVTLLAVPDRTLKLLARSLASTRPGWRRRTFLHHAGSLGPEVLRPLSRRGASVGLLHPLQVLGLRPEVTRDWLGESWARIEGTPAACRIATQLLSDLGMKRLRFRAAPGPAARRSYHAAAALISNDLVALLGRAVQVMVRSGVAPAQAMRALQTLASGALAQIAANDELGDGLTGPVVRGDLETVTGHLRRLAVHDRELGEVHRLLSRALLDLAEHEGRRLPPSVREELAQLLASKQD